MATAKGRSIFTDNGCRIELTDASGEDGPAEVRLYVEHESFDRHLNMHVEVQALMSALRAAFAGQRRGKLLAAAMKPRRKPQARSHAGTRRSA